MATRQKSSSGLGVLLVIVVAVLAVEAPGVLDRAWDAAREWFEEGRRDERCPVELSRAETDASWAAKVQAGLGDGDASGVRTRGLFCYAGGRGNAFSSGKDDGHKEIDAKIAEYGISRPSVNHLHPVSTHVEAKAAWFAFEQDIKRSVLVINRRHMCGSRGEPYSCVNVVNKLLPGSAQMSVWTVGSAQPRVVRGVR